MARREKANYLIQSVSHSLDVLEELARAGGEIGVTELSKRLKLHKNNVFRLLATLELRGYVEQNRQSENYRLGVRVLQLGQSYLSQSTLIARALPYMRELSEKVGETVSIAVLRSGYVQYPMSIETKRPVRVAARSNQLISAKMCSVGRLLTAQLSDAVLAEMLAANSPQDAAIRTQLQELRTNGSIVDRGASEPDVISVAKILRGSDNEVVGALEIVAPQYRSKSDMMMAALEETAALISQSLGVQTQSLSRTIQRDVVSSSVEHV